MQTLCGCLLNPPAVRGNLFTPCHQLPLLGKLLFVTLKVLPMGIAQRGEDSECGLYKCTHCSHGIWSVNAHLHYRGHMFSLQGTEGQRYTDRTVETSWRAVNIFRSP